MANTAVLAQAKSLLPLVKDADGVISSEKLIAVAKELLKSNQGAKRALVRQLAVLAESEQTRQLAEVTSAIELPKSTQEEIMKLVKKHHPEVKKFTWQVDPELLGGFTIKVADTWYDASVIADLKTIRQQLSQ